MTRSLLCCLVVFVAAVVSAADGETPDPVLLDVEQKVADPPAIAPAVNGLRRSTSATAATLAVADLEAIAAVGEDIDTSPYRYVWCPDGRSEHGIVAFVLNSVVSRTDLNFAVGLAGSPIQPVADDLLLRVDFRGLCPKPSDLQETLKVWDSMRNPYFRLQLNEKVALGDHGLFVVGNNGAAVVEGTKTLHRMAAGQECRVLRKQVNDNVDWLLVEHAAGNGWVRSTDGTVKPPAIDATLKANLFAPHLDEQVAASLQSYAESAEAANSVIWCQTLYQQSLTQADGGKYYAFMGLKKSAETGVSDLDSWLKSIGVEPDPDKRLAVEQRAGVVYSQVTGKARRVDWLTSPRRPASGQGLVVITQDVLDKDKNRVEADPLRNLVKFETGGCEVLFERPNGHLGFILFDGQGGLADFAPPDLVTDDRIPAPHTKRLEPAISCIRCHGDKNADGWRDVVNVASRLVAGQQMTVVGDANTGNKLSVAELQTLLAGLYQGDLNKPLRRAREDLAEAVHVSTFGHKVGDLPLEFSDVAKQLSDAFLSYSYSLVTPRQAAMELGWSVPDQIAVPVLQAMLGRLPADPVTGVAVEDPYLLLLLDGTAIVRYQWESVYAEAAVRAASNSAAAAAAAAAAGAADGDRAVGVISKKE